jgi:5'-nucleotidase
MPDCGGRAPFAGARFQFLAANSVVAATGKPLFAPYAIKLFDGVKVGFIGLTLQGTAALVRPGGTAGVQFANEVATVNELLPELKAKGVNAIVVVMHEGGTQTGDINSCADFSGVGLDLALDLPKEVDVVVQAHTHRHYICSGIAGKLVTSAGSYGAMLTEIDITLDRASGRMVSKQARNVWVDPDGAKAPALTALLNDYLPRAEPLEKRVVATLAHELTTVSTPAGESLLGNVVVDAQLAATSSPDRGGAVIAFNNSTSVRSPLIPDATGGVTYGMLFAAQPFQNDLVVLNLTGAQIKRVLEQQLFGVAPGERRRFLNASRGFRYAWDASKPIGERVIAASMSLNGQPVRADLQYRVAVNSFLAGGGDSFSVFTEGTERQVSVQDLEALVSYLAAQSSAQPYRPSPVGERIARLN